MKLIGFVHLCCSSSDTCDNVMSEKNNHKNPLISEAASSSQPMCPWRLLSVGKMIWMRSAVSLLDAAFCTFLVAPALLKLASTWNSSRMTHAGEKKKNPAPTGASGAPRSVEKQVSVCQIASFRSAALGRQGEREQSAELVRVQLRPRRSC